MSLYVYHYTSARNAIGILNELGFRLSTLSRCNDPKESKNFKFSVVLRTDKIPEDLRGVDPDALSDEVTQLMKDNWRVLCVTRDSAGAPHSLWDGPIIPPMWAHYADKHRGVCLILRFPELNESVSKLASRFA